MHARLHVHPHACVIGAGAHARGAFYWGEVWQCEGIEAGGSQMSLVGTSTLMSLAARSLAMYMVSRNHRAKGDYHARKIK